MQLSHATSKETILNRAIFLAFGDSTDHTTAWPLADMVASANRAVAKIGMRLWQASSTWVWDDQNQTAATIPVTSFSLVTGTAVYAIPATVFAIKAVQIKDISGNWYPLTQITYEDIANMGYAPDEYRKTNGRPEEYMLDGYNIRLFSPPDTALVTASSGMKAFISREPTSFATPATLTTADTTNPGFPEQYHDAVPLYMAYEWCLTNGPMDRAAAYKNEIIELVGDIFKTETVKNTTKKNAFTPFRNNYL